ncbi:HAD family hydrolase [Nocardioides acrostichi]|uniref:HAD family hydrolase n=1 Tax=Nocardioides acrostichi TaxID=2784339 RepID=A0A930Y6R9_9ACTN|nr:hypothetical protein [Nocardioides acrostichi]MBF4162665.1 hypothetical protein [Nocardioides acrostichi]
MSPSPAALVAVDLDQTLIYSRRSARFDPDSADAPEHVWVEDYDGSPQSLMTRAAHERLEALMRTSMVVPCTTRTVAQYSRVRLPQTPQHAICTNGAVVLTDGRPDEEWTTLVADALAGAGSAQESATYLRRHLDEGWVKTVSVAEDVFAYLVAHDRDGISEAWVAQTSAWAAPRRLTVSVQGRKVYLVPSQVTKAAAARHLADRHGLPLLAAGDSLLDLPLLLEAEVAVRPPHGELAHLTPPAEGPWPLQAPGPPGAVAAESVLAVLADASRGGPRHP